MGDSWQGFDDDDDWGFGAGSGPGQGRPSRRGRPTTGHRSNLNAAQAEGKQQKGREEAMDRTILQVPEELAADTWENDGWDVELASAPKPEQETQTAVKKERTVAAAQSRSKGSQSAGPHLGAAILDSVLRGQSPDTLNAPQLGATKSTMGTSHAPPLTDETRDMESGNAWDGSWESLTPKKSSGSDAQAWADLTRTPSSSLKPRASSPAESMVGMTSFSEKMSGRPVVKVLSPFTGRGKGAAQMSPAPAWTANAPSRWRRTLYLCLGGLVAMVLVSFLSASGVKGGAGIWSWGQLPDPSSEILSTSSSRFSGMSLMGRSLASKPLRGSAPPAGTASRGGPLVDPMKVRQGEHTGAVEPVAGHSSGESGESSGDGDAAAGESVQGIRATDAAAAGGLGQRIEHSSVEEQSLHGGTADLRIGHTIEGSSGNLVGDGTEKASQVAGDTKREEPAGVALHMHASQEASQSDSEAGATGNTNGQADLSASAGAAVDEVGMQARESTGGQNVGGGGGEAAGDAEQRQQEQSLRGEEASGQGNQQHRVEGEISTHAAGRSEVEASKPSAHEGSAAQTRSGDNTQVDAVDHGQEEQSQATNYAETGEGAEEDATGSQHKTGTTSAEGDASEQVAHPVEDAAVAGATQHGGASVAQDGTSTDSQGTGAAEEGEEAQATGTSAEGTVTSGAETGSSRSDVGTLNQGSAEFAEPKRQSAAGEVLSEQQRLKADSVQTVEDALSHTDEKVGGALGGHGQQLAQSGEEVDREGADAQAVDADVAMSMAMSATQGQRELERPPVTTGSARGDKQDIAGERSRSESLAGVEGKTDTIGRASFGLGGEASGSLESQGRVREGGQAEASDRSGAGTGQAVSEEGSSGGLTDGGSGMAKQGENQGEGLAGEGSNDGPGKVHEVQDLGDGSIQSIGRGQLTDGGEKEHGQGKEHSSLAGDAVGAADAVELRRAVQEEGMALGGTDQGQQSSGSERAGGVGTREGEGAQGEVHSIEEGEPAGGKNAAAQAAEGAKQQEGTLGGKEASHQVGQGGEGEVGTDVQRSGRGAAVVDEGTFGAGGASEREQREVNSADRDVTLGEADPGRSASATGHEGLVGSAAVEGTADGTRSLENKDPTHARKETLEGGSARAQEQEAGKHTITEQDSKKLGSYAGEQDGEGSVLDHEKAQDAGALSQQKHYLPGAGGQLSTGSVDTLPEKEQASTATADPGKEASQGMLAQPLEGLEGEPAMVQGQNAGEKSKEVSTSDGRASDHEGERNKLQGGDRAQVAFQGSEAETEPNERGSRARAQEATSADGLDAAGSFTGVPGSSSVVQDSPEEKTEATGSSAGNTEPDHRDNRASRHAGSGNAVAIDTRRGSSVLGKDEEQGKSLGEITQVTGQAASLDTGFAGRTAQEKAGQDVLGRIEGQIAQVTGEGYFQGISTGKNPVSPALPGTDLSELSGSQATSGSQLIEATSSGAGDKQLAGGGLAQQGLGGSELPGKGAGEQANLDMGASSTASKSSLQEQAVAGSGHSSHGTDASISRTSLSARGQNAAQSTTEHESQGQVADSDAANYAGSEVTDPGVTAGDKTRDIAATVGSAVMVKGPRKLGDESLFVTEQASEASPAGTAATSGVAEGAEAQGMAVLGEAGEGEGANTGSTERSGGEEEGSGGSGAAEMALKMINSDPRRDLTLAASDGVARVDGGAEARQEASAEESKHAGGGDGLWDMMFGGSGSEEGDEATVSRGDGEVETAQDLENQKAKGEMEGRQGQGSSPAVLGGEFKQVGEGSSLERTDSPVVSILGQEKKDAGTQGGETKGFETDESSFQASSGSTPSLEKAPEELPQEQSEAKASADLTGTEKGALLSSVGLETSHQNAGDPAQSGRSTHAEGRSSDDFLHRTYL